LIVVIGAGLAGCCVALDLAQRGFDVTLIDQDEQPMNRASLRNEGKIHLGLIYANDMSNATGSLQLQAALRFAPLLERWLGPDARQLGVSTCFDYVVAHDSLLPAQTLANHYRSIERAYERDITANPELHYLGRRPDQLVRRLAPEEWDGRYAREAFQAVFRTEERAVVTEQLASLVRGAVEKSDRISFVGNRRIGGIDGHRGRFSLTGQSVEGSGALRVAGRPFAFGARQVVNATWEHRSVLDQTLGLAEATDVVHRLKYRVIAEVPQQLRHGPSATMVLGRYGDVVMRPDGTAYLSWYPAGLRRWSRESQPPFHWEAPSRGFPPQHEATTVAEQTLAGIATWLPAVRFSRPLTVDAGAIVARGHSDVDDPASGLHMRSRIGVTSRGGYHSVDPGKLTSAPMFALEAAGRVAAAVRAAG